MTQHEKADDQGAPSVVAHSVVDDAEQQAPRERSRETVGVRVENEIKRVRRHVTGHDSHLLDAEQQKDRPQLVEQLGREHRRP